MTTQTPDTTDQVRAFLQSRELAKWSSLELVTRLYDQYDAMAKVASRHSDNEQAASIGVTSAAMLLAASYFDGGVDDFVALAADTFDTLHPPTR